MGLVALGASLWFLYDGAVKWPHQRERGLALKNLLEENRLNEWDAYARERGWSTSDPGEPKTESEIFMQFVWAGITALVGLWLLAGVWLARGRWIESTGSGITSSWGQIFNFDQVVQVNKRKWRSKGIAKVAYQDGRRKRRFTIDDYKFDRQPTGQILRDLEAHIEPDKIVFGPPEAVTDALSEQPIDADPTEVHQSIAGT
jgi:hypothetical protein